MSDAEQKKLDRAYSYGRRALATELLVKAAAEIGCKSITGRLGIMTAELERVRAALREVCEEHGDNEWSDDLDLEDVIRKHLQRHLDKK